MVSGINLFNLKGKRALVTGSSQGIGYALAKGLDQAPEWEELELCVDSGASATVIGEHMLGAIELNQEKQEWSTR